MRPPVLFWQLDVPSRSKFLLLLCVFTLCNDVDGVPSDTTARKARCYANCLTQNAATNATEKPCQTSACKECLIPCGTPFSGKETCIQSCKNASSCEKSCEFLTQLQNFSSILAGDGSIPPTPGIATVTNKTFTSITLQWDPVQNTSGIPVYLIEVAFTGEQSRYSPLVFSEVFVSTQATLRFEHPCFYTPRPIRYEYTDILYRFKVVVLTENSSISYGPQTAQITLPKPDPVSNVTLDSLVYDSATSLDKVKLTASWIPSNEQKDLISYFGMAWSMNTTCDEYALPRTEDTSGPLTTASMHIWQQLLKCVHTLQIYSIIGCSVSDPTELKYTYPGCQNITDYPANDCYKFDPPDAPMKDRMVSNIRLDGPMIAQSDYRFQVTVTWDPPVYPYKNVQMYIVQWLKKASMASSRFLFTGSGVAFNDRRRLNDLLPGTTYQVKIRPFFYDGKPWSNWTYANIITPDVNPDQVKVRNLRTGQFSTSQGGGSFSVNVSWEKPTFNYSTLNSYKLFYQAGSNNNTLELLPPNTRHVISGILHGERVNYRVTPRYKHEAWIKGIAVLGNATAPVPRDDDVMVKNIKLVFALENGRSTIARFYENGSSTFSVNVTWTGPVFNFTFRSYYIVYELSGYPTDIKPTDPHKNVKKPELLLSGIKPKQLVKIKITPLFDNPYIKKLEASGSKYAPKPDPSTVTIQNMTYTELNTSTSEQIDYLISWQKPLFKESNVTIYDIKYRRTGNPNREKLFEFTKGVTYFPVYDVIPGDKLEIEVTPEFAASVITGISSQMTIEPRGPNSKEIEVRGLSRESFVEDEESNTFSVNFTWQSPSFKHSKPNSYIVSYEFYGGYTRKQLSCTPFVRDKDRSGCSGSHGVNETLLQISGIFPSESVSVKVTPIYSNIHITGQVAEERVTAPQPKEELVQVNGLKYDELVLTANDTFRTTVSWQKPLFTHSEVEYYKYKLLATDNPQRKRRGIPLNTAIRTTGTNVTFDGISRVDGVEFKVSPVFVVSGVTGIDIKIRLVWKSKNEPSAEELTTAELAGLVVGLLLAALIAICLTVWCYREGQRQMKARGRVSGKNALMIDHWEVDGDLVTLEEELGEGAFGKVYKGILKELSTPSRKLSMMPPINAIRKNTIKRTEGFTVAVKMLHGMADSEQRREFLEEIQLMKAVGSHKNIVNMLGCCTVEEPMFLLVEYIPYGDLLHYLRKRRGKVKEYLGDESRGPYRSTYCETYVIDSKPGRISIQATRKDRVYVNNPETQKGDNGNIQILSFTQSSKMDEETGMENKGIANDEASDEEDENEETLTPGDLLAFAWQVSEGMEYLARKGFVHRDLAARNVLVGEHKIAKVADFGLTRHVYEEKVYHAKRNRKLPLKWMSIEAIFDQTFTSQSDVWAFGVVLWELVTLGGTPYPTINNRELLRLLKGGYRMEKPDICNDEMYSMMTDCWMENPDERPNFTLIRERLEAMMQVDNPYLDFSVLDESRDYYNVPSFNSLMDESADDDLFDKDSEELLKDGSDDGISVGEGRPTEDSNRNEITPMKNPDMEPQLENIDSVDINKIEFNNTAFCGKDFHCLKDVKVNIDSLEMALYRPGNRGITL